tara:strand:- start:9849 stop:10052 length:204 start_codon:yes stop_codon:yes gene_type:complete
MSKKRLNSLLFWGFFIGIFYLSSIEPPTKVTSKELPKTTIKDTCIVLKTKKIILWTDGTWTPDSLNF